MKGPRLRIVLPVAVLLTLVAPILRQLPGAAQLPDVWLLFLLLVVPVPAPNSWRRPIQLVLLLGLLRSSVTAISPYTAWAGFGAGLFVREVLARRLSEYNPLLRLVIGFSAAVPLAVLDRLAAESLGVTLPSSDLWLRCLLTGLVLAALQRPTSGRLLRSGGNG